MIDIYFTTFLAVMGAVIGSFLNVVIYRLPLGKNWANGRSACPKCEAPITWKQNIPVLSYLVLKGRCARCRKPISVRYPLVEMVTAALFGAAYLEFGFGSDLAASLLLIVTLVVITGIDIDHQIIPDVITYPAAVAGVLFAFSNNSPELADALIGAATGYGVFFALNWTYILVRKREAMGMGDAKLFAVLGLFLGWQALLPIFIVAVFSCFFFILAHALVCKGTPPKILPFGPFLSLGGLSCLFFDPAAIQSLLFRF
ncbi:prepilin peptidase [Geoalkalibacter subterraneus]|uniref:Prepilin leader peptidase/N-methyltransferase n=1 Tax=Geoalkalibacter subterraneus TaxID=483547 RepID=A0A0B5FVB2_9BACT|nr:A24 family peptidase [Geoalkalibacter subterraneus]AJF08120.1 hypothetical protein GSUB_16550 [Geoalkalibacter subterraneus]